MPELSLGYGFKMKSRCFKNIRIRSIYCIIYTLFFYVFGYPLILNSTSAEIVDRIVAVVNDDVITLTELNSSLKPYAEKIRSLGYPREKEQQLLFKVRKEILDHLINEKIEDQEIKRSKVEISEDQIDRTIEQLTFNCFAILFHGHSVLGQCRP